MRKSLTIAGLGSVAGLLAARRVAYAPPDPEIAARAEAAQHSGPWTHGFVEANGLKFHYAEIGSGPLVLLLHGFPQCWFQWRYVMVRLAPHFHVVAPDMRGYNLSDKPKGVGEYTLDKLARDVSALVDALGEEKAHVVGHDWGGVVAWRLGMDHPHRVDNLTVINAPHPAVLERELKGVEQLLRSYYVFFFQLPLLPEATMRLTIRRGLRSSAAIPGAFTDEALDVYENGISQPGAATVMINYYRATGRTGFGWFKENRRKVEVPAMLLWGMKDFALSPRLVEGVEEWVPGIRVERAEDSGHWVPEEKPRWVAERLLEFLSP